MLAFYIDGTEAKTLKLVKEIPYSFNILSPTHPFHISTDPIGGSTAGMVSSGQSGAPSDNGTVVFTPTNSSPSTLYYDCSNHQYMGAPVSVVDGYCTEDLSGLHSGKYSVIVRDANGCEANATFTVNEEGEPATIDAIQNLFCYGATDGSVSILTSGSNPPYTLSGSGPVFSVIVEVKNHSHPQYGQGSRPDGFTIDGVQGRESTLVRGITYAFSVFAPSHEFFISTSDVGGPLNTASVVTDGVTNNFVAVGTLFFTPNALHPNLLYYQCGIHDYMGWKLNIVDGISDLNVNNLVAGDYSLVATDASGCPSPPITFTIQQPAPTIFYYDGDSDGFGIETESTLACSAPLGFSDVAGDCDDFDSGITGIISYSDVDGDGFGDPLTRIGTCTLPVGNVLDGSDCNDQDAAINPGASEVCNGIDDNCDGLVDNGIVCQLTVNVKIMIQGYFDGVNLMRAVSDPLAFPGTSDTITVQLASSLPPYDIMYASQNAVSLSGIGAFTFPPEVSGGDFYIVIKHRSSLEIWSAISYTISDNFTFDCQMDPAQVLGSNLADLGNGFYGMWSGDVNQDGLIDENDFVSVETDLPLFSQGYLSQDLDGNQIIESADYSLIENNSAFGLSVIHP
ncbi:MAG: putative metal-binding motif-containing protein [Bacteroidetes bacterium]|nr:putative metal-binding motif-containing protein [Bacteroidota bacterium]